MVSSAKYGTLPPCHSEMRLGVRIVSPSRGHVLYDATDSRHLCKDKPKEMLLVIEQEQNKKNDVQFLRSMTYDTRRDAYPTSARRGCTGWGIRSRRARRSACASARRKGSRTACAPSPAAPLPAASSSPTVWMRVEGLCRQEAGRH